MKMIVVLAALVSSSAFAKMRTIPANKIDPQTRALVESEQLDLDLDNIRYDDEQDDPFLPDEQTLSLQNEFLNRYAQGQEVELDLSDLIEKASGGCTVHAALNVDGYQVLQVEVNGRPVANWRASSGIRSRPTPLFKAKHAIEKRPRGFRGNPLGHDSSAYPGGGLPGWGNMGSPVFFTQYHAIHSTAAVSNLGSRASHGCIRVDLANALTFYKLADKYGRANTCLTVYEDRELGKKLKALQ